MNEMQQLKNLIVMAAADGKFTESELLLLADRCHELGLSTADLRKALNEATQEGAELVIPDDHSERLTLLRYLMRMMAADGKLAPTEKQLFAFACARMEIDKIEIDELIDQLLSEQKVALKAEPLG